MLGIFKKAALATMMVGVMVGCSDPTITRARKAVSDGLFDPDSAKFQNEAVVSPGHVCGYVNAKNRMGAYVGASPYIYSEGTGAQVLDEYPTKRDLQSLELTSANDEMWNQLYREIEYRCLFVQLWNSSCAPKLGKAPEEATVLCGAWSSNRGDIRRTMEQLGVASLRDRY